MVGVDDAGNILAGGAFDRIKNAANGLLPALDTLPVRFQAMSASLAPVGAIAGRVFGVIGDFLRNNSDLVKNFIVAIAVIGPTFMAVAVAVAFFSSAIGAFVVTITVISAIVAGIVTAYQRWRAATIALGAGIATVAAIIIGPMVGAFLASIPAAIAAAAAWIAAFAPFILIGAVVAGVV
jgi:carbon starvation protein CstA